MNFLHWKQIPYSARFSKLDFRHDGHLFEKMSEEKAEENAVKFTH
jgi:hypothetical protein